MPIDRQRLQQLSVQAQDELNQALEGFKRKGWEHFRKVLAVAAALGVVGYVGLYKSTASSLVVVKRKVGLLREVSKYALEYRDYKLKLAALKEKFPTEAEQKDWLFSLLLGSAKQEQIAIDAISSQREEARPELPFLKLAIDVTAKGGYHQVGGWVARLESAGRFTQVEGMNLSKIRRSGPEAAAADSGNTVVQLTLATVIPRGAEGL